MNDNQNKLLRKIKLLFKRRAAKRKVSTKKPKIAWYTFTPEKILEVLKSDRQIGLSWKQVEERTIKYGRNILPAQKKQSWVKRLAEQFNNVLIYILIAAAALTSILGHWIDTSVILTVVVINSMVGFLQEGKAEKALDAIRNMLSHNADVIRDGVKITLPADALVPGDIVILSSGDKVPADIRLIKTHSFQVQEAILTGESNPVEKQEKAIDLTSSLADRSCMAYSSTLVTYGRAKGVVTATGADTEIGKISSLIGRIERITTPLLKQLAHFARLLTLSIVILAAITIVLGVLIHGYGWEEMFIAAVGLAVAAIPEGLPAIMTITLAIGVTRMAKQNAIIRRLPAVETMGAVSVICTDKTGTLTRNELSVDRIITSEHEFTVTGSGYTPRGEFFLNDKVITPNNYSVLKTSICAAILCNESDLNKLDGEWKLSGNPTDGALLALALKAKMEIDFEKKSFPQTDLIPFESEHKLMATLHHDHVKNGYIFVKGAPENILDMCDKQLVADGEQDIDHRYWNNKITEMAQQGQRVIAIAKCNTSPEHRTLSFKDLMKGLTIISLYSLLDPPREETLAAIQECRSAGIRVKMITGDHELTARAVAKKLSIGELSDEVLTGKDLDNLSHEQLEEKVLDIDIYARTSPEHKLRLVQALQKMGQVVAMTGDGVNDAPALKRADIGVAMGLKGTETSKEVSEMVIADDNFASIAHAVEEGRTVYQNIKKAIIFILPTNGGEAFTLVTAILLGTMLPITPVQILWVNMITAVTLGLSLAFEPSDRNIMKQKPRSPTEPLLSKLLMWRILFVSFILVLGTFGLFYYHLDKHGIEISRTIAVNTLVFGEIFYLINCRNISGSSLKIKFWINSKPIFIAISSVIFFQLLFTYSTPMHYFFNTAPLSLQDWVPILLFGFILYLLVELEKYLVRKFNLFEPKPRKP